MTYQPKQPSTISERRSQYPLNERLVVYNTESMQRMIENKTPVPNNPTNTASNTFVINGVNILNKTSVDSDTMMHRIMQRRQTHNRVERRRRDRMNNLFHDLSKCLPSLKEKQENNRADILQEAIHYIKYIESENLKLKEQSRTIMLPPLEDDDSSSISTQNDTPSYIPSPPSSVENSPKRPVMTMPQTHYESILTFE